MTRVVSAVLLASLAFPGLSACSQGNAATDLKAEATAVGAVEEAMRAAYRAKDPAKLAAVYTQDASLFVPGEQRPRIGAAAIAEAAKKDFADPAFHITFTTAKVGVAAAGDTAWSKGSFSLRYTDPETKGAAGYSGFYLTLFAKQKDGSWKVTEDMATPAS